MSGKPDSFDYWLRRLALAVEHAAAAPGIRSRAAYLDLARHYWSMHVMVHGQGQTSEFAIPELIDAAAMGSPAPLQWAA